MQSLAFPACLRPSRVKLLALVLAAELIVVFGLVGLPQASEGEKTVLGGLLSKMLSTPSSQVSIGAVEGALSSDASIRDVVLSDADGPWLKLDRARLVWSRLALLAGRLEVDSLEVGRLEVLRKPLPSPAPPPTEPPDGKLLPELPVKVEVKAFKLAELVLGESLAGQAARLSADGKVKLGNPAEGLDLSLEARRLDAPGRFVTRLLFVPKGERLEVKASLVEAQGGLLSKAAGLLGEPPINFDLDGRGTLDSWNGKLDFDAGPDIGAKGTARIARAGAERRLSLDLNSRIEGLVPGPAAAIFAGTTKLEAGLGFSDGGAFRIERLELTSRTARLGIAGAIGSDRVADLTVQARAVPNEGGVTKSGETELETLVFDASLKGPLASPLVKGVLKAGGIRTKDSGLDRVEASIGVEPLGADPKAPRFSIQADARIDGLRLADPALSRAIGAKATLALRAASQPDGVIDVASLVLESDSARLSYAGRIGQNTLSGDVKAALSDLSVYSGLAGRALAGRVEAKASLSGDPARKSVAAAIDLRGDRLVLGTPVADRLLGAQPSLTGKLAQAYDGYAFEAVTLTGAGMTASLHGQATATRAEVAARLDVKTLAALDERLGGPAGIEARLTGSLQKPDLVAAISAPEVKANGKPIRNLRLDATVTDLTGALDGTVRLSGDIAGKALTGDAHVAKTGRTEWTLDRLALALGSVSVDGNALVDAKSLLSEARLAIRAGNLDDLSTLALAPMGGSLDAAVTLTREGGRQEAAIRATGAALRYDAFGLSKLDADLKGHDLMGKPVLDGRLNADRIVASSQTIDTVRLTASGTPEASDISLTAQARGFALDGAARIAPGERTRIDLQRFAVTRGGDRFALTGPATFTLAQGAVAIENLAIAAGGGRISVHGSAGKSLDLTIGIKGLPLSLARIASPTLSLSGTLDGEAELRGPAERPEGHYALTVSRLVTPETRKAGLPPIDARASGSVSGGHASIDGRVSAGKGAEISVTGSLPIETGGALNVNARGRLDAALANSMLSAGGQRLTGNIALDARVAGTVAAPRVEGSATLSGGSLTDPLNGLRITDIQGRVSGKGDTIVIERLTASAKNGGRLSVEGKVAVEPSAGFPGTIRITADRAELVSSPLITAVSSLNLTINGPLARAPRIGGRVDVVSVEVSVPSRLPASAKPLDGIRRVNTSPQVRARLASRDAKKNEAANAGGKGGRGKGAAPFEAALDLVVSAPNRIFVRGRGMDVELGGELRIAGTSNAPRAIGDFELRRGRFSLAGTRLDFTKGKIDFAGDLTSPELDFSAETKAAEVTARIRVTGPASQPVIGLSSDPSLAQDEVLSRLLFQKASGGLSPLQALQLAQAVAELSGYSSGPGMLDQARKGLGLDNLDVSTGSTGGPTVGGSKYISDRMSVGVKAGAKPADTAATVDYDITRRVKVRGEAGSDGRTAVGVGAEWEW